MRSRLLKGLVWLIKFYHRIYINLWLRRRGYAPVPAGEYIRAVKKEL
ncbi:MAG: hypothetical protein KJ077_35700 [Anaerolineae bacterium]|nr:hypothetical protein [Anaerolineae bacterium]